MSSNLGASILSVKGHINLRKDGKSDLDMSDFNFQSIAIATENFSNSRKIGHVGFGSAYKGTFPEGQELAEKRLCKCSQQGLEEFKNEVLLIARLQHRNLVRLLGHCIEAEEKILLYEFMPNKSLDCFLFDTNRSKALDWKKRFNIILGIARGLLYLHQDSRLRIIHRDLKTSNILLDEELNPKISDFGIARIFKGNGTEENTNRVVGTYGYMPPEYVSHGLFSLKSDVFSFGVILLEIISGKKNSSTHQFENSMTLPAHAFQLWTEDRGLDLMDPSLSEACDTTEVLKCIHVGLLCVQEAAADRPTMNSVVAMLASETATLHTPKQPGFFINKEFAPNNQRTHTRPELTLTTMEGRRG